MLHRLIVFLRSASSTLLIPHCASDKSKSHVLKANFSLLPRRAKCNRVMAAASEASNIEIIDDSKNTNVHVLACNGDHEALAQFASGAKIDAQNTYGLTPLMFAARYGHLEAVEALLDLRADATKLNKYGGSVFQMAVASGSLDVINILLQHLLSGGVSRQAIETLFSPISLSIIFGHEHVFKFLLGNKFNVKAISLYTELTPLMYAALNENPIYTEHLMLMGADPRVRNANKETCQDLEQRRKGHEPNKPQPQPQQLQLKIPSVAQLQQLQQHQQQEPPLMVVSQPQQHYNLHRLHLPRKSSNTITPELLTPTISPVGFYPQVFFPADFSNSQLGSPTYLFHCAYSPFTQDYVMSPVYNIPSPFHNLTLHNQAIATEDVFFL